MNIDQLKQLFPQLKEYGVTHFRLGNLEIKMPESKTFGAPKMDSLPEMQDVPDFKGDDLMNYDKVLHWSSAGTGDEIDMPLTGEKPLDEVI